jgi:hypothetical protein
MVNLFGKKRSFIVATLVISSILTIVIITNSTKSIASNDGWHKIGTGNLGVMGVQNGWVLYPEPTTYILGLQGSKGKEYKLGSEKTYFLDSTLNSKALANTKTKAKVGPDQREFIRTNDYTFSASDSAKTLSSGVIITGTSDNSNLWITSNDGTSSKELLNNTGYDILKDEISKANENKGEDKLYLDWGSNPIPLDEGKLIAFTSNKQTISSGDSNESVYVVKQDGSNETLLIDSKKYGGMRLVGASKDIVVAHNAEKFSLLVANASTSQVKEYLFNGWADALSPDGTNLVFRKVVGMYIQKDLWILNLTTGIEAKVEGMPNDYFYNTGGEWSPDGTKFAFYANGFNNIDKNKIYRDNNLLSVIDTANFNITSYGKPQVSANLYPLGALHWIGNENILTYLDDDSSWSFKVPTTGGNK